MKKLLILIVGFAIFLHFYPQPELEDWVDEQAESLFDGYGDVFDTKAQLNVDKVWTDLQSQLHSFTAKEKLLLREITLKRHATKVFYRDYCVARKREHTFQEDNQKRVCLTIHKYRSQF